MALSEIQTSFAGGELSPQLYARVDLEKFQVGAALLRNFFVDYRGGAANRPGTRYIATQKDPSGTARLIPFVVSTLASYVLEFGDQYIRFYSDGAVLESSPGVPYEVSTPYAAADLALLKYTQSADVLTIVHPSYPPANLSRLTATTFSYAAIVVGPVEQPPVITTMTAPHSGPYNFGYLVTAVSLDGNEESLPSNIGVKDCEPMNETTNRVIGLGWTDSSTPILRYNVYKWGPIDAVTMVPATVWGFIGSSQATAFSDINIAPDFTKQPPIWGDPFSGGQIESIQVTGGGSGYDGESGDWPVIPYVPLSISGDGTGAAGYAVIDHANGVIIGAYLTNPGKNYTTATITANGEGGTGATFSVTFSAITPLYPSCVSYIQQRRVFAGSNLKPETFVMSQPGLYDNFNTTPVALDTDAIVATVASQEVNTIKSLVPVSYGLLAFTTGGCFLISGGGPTEPISPLTISATAQASPGANDLQPLTVNYDIVFGQAKGNRIRNASFAWERQSYTVGDVSQLASHLFDTYQTTDWCWAEEPFKIIWAVRNDGRLLSLTYVPEQQVYAWARHDTQGLFRSVCSVPEGDTNAVYVIVERFVENNTGDPCWVRYIERFAERQGCCIFDSWFLDSALTLPRTTIDGPLYLSGATGDISLFSYDPCSDTPSGGFGTGSYTFDGNFTATVSNALAASIGTVGDIMDQWGNAWTAGNHVTGTANVAVIDQTGTILNSTTGGLIMADVITFANLNGGAFPPPGGSDNGFALATVGYDGTKYVIVFLHKYMNTGVLFYDLIGILDAASDGTYTVVGAAWTRGHDTVNERCYKIDLAGTKTLDDYICVQIGINTDFGGMQWVVFPSVNDIIAQPAAGVVTNRFEANPTFAPGDTYHGWSLPMMNGDLGTNAGGSDQASFLMPDGSGGQDICTYVSKSTATLNVASVPFVTTLAGSYPNGVLTKAPLDLVTYPPTFGSPSVGLVGLTPVAAPGSFSDGASTYDSFTDVWTYFDGSSAGSGAGLDYYGVPRIISRTATGFLVGWYAPWFTDTSYDGATNWTVKEKLRLMDFDTSTGVYTDTVLLEGATAPILSIGDRAGLSQDAIDINGWGVFDSGGNLYIWHMDGGSAGDSGTHFTWLSQVAASVADLEGDIIQIGCGKVQVTSVVSSTELTGTVVEPLDVFLPDDPSPTPVPIPTGGWFAVTPTQVVTGLDHLEGKEVWALADGVVVGPLTVASGSVDLGFTASSVVVGLRYTSQIKTLYLTADGINQGSEQGKRKMLPAVTLRLDCTRGLEVGNDFSYLTPLPDTILAGTNDLFEGDARALIYPQWDTKGEICIQQSDPLPAQVLGVIVEVVPGDTGR